MTPSRAALALAFLLGACAPEPALQAPPPALPPAVAPPPPPVASAPVVDDSFRLHAPDAEHMPLFVPPAIAGTTLRNGIRVYAAHMASPFVAIRVIASGGLPDVSSDHVETANLLATVLRLGTKDRDVYKLDSDYLSIGMRPVEVEPYADGIVVSLVVPVEKLGEGVKLAAEIALRPLFDDKLFERAREQIARARELNLLDTSEVAEHVLRRALFGSHPYGSTVGTPKQTRDARRDEVVKLHALVFDPARLSIVVTGSASQDEVVSTLNDAFVKDKPAAQHHASGISPPPPSQAAASTARVILVDRPGNPIASIAAAALGPQGGASDGESLHIAEELLADTALGRLARRCAPGASSGGVGESRRSTSPRRSRKRIAWCAPSSPTG